MSSSLEALRDADLDAKLDHILGLPGEPLSAQEKARDLYTEFQPRRIQTFWLTHLPGVELTRSAVERGELSQADYDDINRGKSGRFHTRSSAHAADADLYRRYAPYGCCSERSRCCPDESLPARGCATCRTCQRAPPTPSEWCSRPSTSFATGTWRASTTSVAMHIRSDVRCLRSSATSCGAERGPRRAPQNPTSSSSLVGSRARWTRPNRRTSDSPRSGRGVRASTRRRRRQRRHGGSGGSRHSSPEVTIHPPPTSVGSAPVEVEISRPRPTSHAPAMVTLVRPPILVPRVALTAPTCPPVGVAYLAGTLRAAGHRVSVIDAVGEAPLQYVPVGDARFLSHGLSPEEIARRVDQHVDVIGVSAMFSHEWPLTRRLIRLLRRQAPDALIVAGGEHITAAPEFSLRDCPELDLAVVGEGEQTLLSIVEAGGEGARGFPAWCLDLRTRTPTSSDRTDAEPDTEPGHPRRTCMGPHTDRHLPGSRVRFRCGPRPQHAGGCDEGLSLSVHLLLEPPDVDDALGGSVPRRCARRDPRSHRGASGREHRLLRPHRHRPAQLDHRVLRTGVGE